MLQQEKEFSAWGLSKIAIRNIVVFFIIVELLAIVSLVKIVLQQQVLRDLDKQQLIETKQDNANKIEQLKNEQIKSIQELNRVIELQSELENEIKIVRNRIKNIKK